LRSFKILVVDDFEPFRRFVCSTLKPRIEFHVIGQASDGLEAVQKVAELEPDLVLLDIGLPKLNGLEVARCARRLAPTARILILSQESSPDVVRETLSLGVLGYVHKPRALRDLIPAIDAVLEGKTFISANIEPTKDVDVQSTHRHEILLCSGDQVLLDEITRFTAAALSAGNAVIALLTKPHQDVLLRRLRAQGVDIAAAIEQGTYIPLEVHDVLSMFMVDDWPDADRISMAVDDIVKGAATGPSGERRRVVVCGEGAPTLLAQGKVEAAIQLERLWYEVVKIHGVDTLCPYPIVEGQEDVIKRLCAEHTAVISL
jgi:DNA-binding NarL/FixJ family response regulator